MEIPKITQKKSLDTSHINAEIISFTKSRHKRQLHKPRNHTLKHTADTKRYQREISFFCIVSGSDCKGNMLLYFLLPVSYERYILVKIAKLNFAHNSRLRKETMLGYLEAMFWPM
ncbi:unnamed protein product [Albugo candida]|uniref:Uncharacterized protein n=1 Tax=Albugo candida TaxID=65357 RepID=A0A024FTK0_9STRA|nr:unnamed protein product [Albugo candida]|eukprot:CCI10257.1 unnamed protein product [Albugo candida]